MEDPMSKLERRPAIKFINTTTDREILRAGWRAIDKLLRETREDSLLNRLPIQKPQQPVI
jgi:hypothetical protein